MDVADYFQSKDYSNKAVRSLCYAPFVSLHFNQTGDVRVCCRSSLVIGNVREKSIDEIWHDAKIVALRETLATGKFHSSCEYCDRHTASGFVRRAPMRPFESFPVKSETPEWPQRILFALSNVCNFECLMCSGAHSSLIRARRERQEPLPKVYSVAFIDSLRPYLAHASALLFSGGEPFLVRENYRIWEMMIEDGIGTACHITTNGSQYNRKVERVIESVPMSFSISLDGASKAMIESVRVNANYEQVIGNAWRFRNYCKEKSTYFTLRYCFMRPNWHEFGDFCRMAERWQAGIGVNIVWHPNELSLYTLPLEELRAVVKAMGEQAKFWRKRLSYSWPIWSEHYERLRAKIRQQEALTSAIRRGFSSDCNDERICELPR